MRAVVIALLVCVPAAIMSSGAENVRLGRMASMSIPLVSNQRGAAAEFRVIETIVQQGSADAARGYVYAVYHRDSRLFWWTFSQEARDDGPDAAARKFIEAYRIAKEDVRIVGFAAYGRSLWIRSSGAKAASLDDGIKAAISNLPEEYGRFASGRGMWFSPINLSAIVGLDFFRTSTLGGVPKGISLVDVRPADEGAWEVTLSGERGQISTVMVDQSLHKATVVERR
jgi:hypothetical protein